MIMITSLLTTRATYSTNAITVDWRCWRAAGVLRAKGVLSIPRFIPGRAPDEITLDFAAQKWLKGVHRCFKFE